MHLVTQAVEAARPAAAAADLSIAVTATEPALASIDARRIRQVLDNLLSNAIKYSDAGGLVQVALQRGDGVLELIVADDGMGIEADEVDRLFTRFFRSGEARARQIPGTGLGLVLVKAFVEAHGGDVELRSEKGAGTTVSVRLPVAGRSSH